MKPLNLFSIVSAFILSLLSLPVAYAGPGGSGGGDMAAAQFSQVALRTVLAIGSVCREDGDGYKDPDPEIQKVCRSMQLSWGHISAMAVRPAKHGKVKGPHGKTQIAAYNDVDILHLDIDQWEALRQAADPSRASTPSQLEDAYAQQIIAAIHEPLVLDKDEDGGSFDLSNAWIDVLRKNHVDLESIILGIPRTAVSSMLQSSNQQTLPHSPTAPDASKIAAQYSAIGKRAYNALESICQHEQTAQFDSFGQEEFTACRVLVEPPLLATAPSIIGIIPLGEAMNSYIRVVPETRDEIKGVDHQVRDAGNDQSATVFLDVDRWNDLQNESDPSRLWEARVQQVTLALHEPLVLHYNEVDDCYWDSNQAVDVLLRNGVNFVDLVGTP